MADVSVSPKQFARLVRYAVHDDDDLFWGAKPTGPYCPICLGWTRSFVNRSSVEAAGLTWEVIPTSWDEEPTSMYVTDLVNLTPTDFSYDEVCVVPMRRATVTLFGGPHVRQSYVPVHRLCLYIEILNGRRQGGLDERQCAHCGRAFHSRERLDWCHLCEKVERTCEHCGGPLRRSFDDRIFGGEVSQVKARADARFCSGRCRVAAHRAKAG